MCTLVILRRPEHDWPVVIGANRDEMIDRPAKPPGRHWPDRAEIVAGLDLLAGGSWLGVNDWGVAAAVLNRHGSLGPAAGLRSRGELVLEALDHADAVDAAAALSDLDPAAYRSFNLIVADNRDAFWLRHAGDRPDRGASGAGRAVDHRRRRSRRTDNAAARAGAAALSPPRRRPTPIAGTGRHGRRCSATTPCRRANRTTAALRFRTPRGFATVSSALIALPAAPSPERPHGLPLCRLAARADARGATSTCVESALYQPIRSEDRHR